MPIKSIVGIRTWEANLSASISACRPCGFVCLWRTKCPNSCNASNLLLSAVLKEFRKIYGIPSRQHENASRFFVSSQSEKILTPLDSNNLITFDIGFSPSPQYVRNTFAAASGSFSCSKFIKSTSGKLNLSETQSAIRYANDPAIKAESLSLAVMAERLRKLTESGVGISMSSPQKKSTGNFSALDRASMVDCSIFSAFPCSILERCTAVIPAKSASPLPVNCLRFLAIISLDGLNMVKLFCLSGCRSLDRQYQVCLI